MDLNQNDVINAYEKFYSNYKDLEKCYIIYNETGQRFSLEEISNEMRNGTKLGKDFIQKIYYRTILDFTELID